MKFILNEYCLMGIVDEFKKFNAELKNPNWSVSSISSNNELIVSLMCAELAGDFHLGDSRQLTDKSLLPFDLVS